MQRIYAMPSGTAAPIEGLTVLNEKIKKSLEINPSFCVEGANKMIIEFIVCEDGKVVGERIINDIITADSKNKLLNLITEIRWNPGSCNDKFVPTLKRIPIIMDFRN